MKVNKEGKKQNNQKQTNNKKQVKEQTSDLMKKTEKVNKQKWKWTKGKKNKECKNIQKHGKEQTN